MRSDVPRLSKSRILHGLQCHKRLYLECYHEDLAAPVEGAARAFLDTGTAVGVLVRERFAGGLLIADDSRHHEDAVTTTRLLLSNPFIPALYEAAFTHDGIRVRADILARTEGGRFDLIEVKATTSVKPHHEWDVAVQLRVLEGAGVPVEKVYLVHLNGEYVYPGGEYDLSALFRAVDVTERARTLRADVSSAIDTIRKALREESPPAIAVGRQCTTPHECPFYDHCHAGAPEFPVNELPDAGDRLLERLRALGIADLREIPREVDGFSPLQRRVVEAVRSGHRLHDSAAREVLSGAAFPIHFLDFETFMPALPVFPGTSPYETIPFQWSDHVLGADGALTHHEYLHDGADDPRRLFAEALIDATAGSGSVVIYTGYEARCLRELERALPDLAPALARLRERLFDLHPVVRNHVYDPEFHGSFSLKTVLPTLLPRLAYEDLAITNGSLAPLAFAELRNPETAPDRAEKLRADLLAYCRRDTEGLLELFRTLR